MARDRDKERNLRSVSGLVEAVAALLLQSSLYLPIAAADALEAEVPPKLVALDVALE